jgi:hypothetical protein
VIQSLVESQRTVEKGRLLGPTRISYSRNKAFFESVKSNIITASIILSEFGAQQSAMSGISRSAERPTPTDTYSYSRRP